MVVAFGEHGLIVISPLLEEPLSRFISSYDAFCVWFYKERTPDTEVVV